MITVNRSDRAYRARIAACKYCGFVANSAKLGRLLSTLSATRKEALDKAQRICDALPEGDRQQWRKITGEITTTFYGCGCCREDS